MAQDKPGAVRVSMAPQDDTGIGVHLDFAHGDGFWDGPDPFGAIGQLQASSGSCGGSTHAPLCGEGWRCGSS